MIQVDTTYGIIEGISSDIMNSFTAIPFAKPPLNELRFSDPQAPDALNTNDIYKAYGRDIPACPQDCSESSGKRGLCPLDSSVISEDCLYLNVYTPSGTITENTNHTVMLWIHGGSFETGWSGGFLHDPTPFLQTIDNVIIVTINYRLGLLGTLYDNEFNTGIHGNFGFLDQKMAIQWTYDNIKAFGGNSENIVLYGESAGADSVSLHLLYNNALISSGIMISPPFGLPLRDPLTWNDVAEDMTELIDCEVRKLLPNDPEVIAECWRAAEWEEIVNIQSSLASLDWLSLTYTPTTCTDLIPLQPVHAFQNAVNSSDIPPYIITANSEEMFYFLNNDTQSLFTYSKLKLMSAVFFGVDDTIKIFEKYNITRRGTDRFDYAFARIASDAFFKCAVRNVTMSTVDLHDGSGGDDAIVYSHEFNDIDAAFYAQIFTDKPDCVDGHVCHTSELYYLWFPDVYDTGNRTENMAGLVMDSFGNFAKNRNPNVGGDGGEDVWKRYGNERNVWAAYYDYDYYGVSEQSICDFWDDIGYAGGMDCGHSDGLIGNLFDSLFEVDSRGLSIDVVESDSEEKENNNSQSTVVWGMDAYAVVYALIGILCVFVLCMGILLYCVCKLQKEKPYTSIYNDK